MFKAIRALKLVLEGFSPRQKKKDAHFLNFSATLS